MMYKIKPGLKGGYDLMKLGLCGLWEAVSHHDSKERAGQAMKRAENREIMKAWK